MRICTESFSPLDHIAIEVSDIAEYVDFFAQVMGMKICRTMGSDTAPDSVWLDGGIQLVKAAKPSQGNGRFQHLGFQVVSVDAVLEKARLYGAAPVPGKGRHWFMLPDGLVLELKEQPDPK